MRRYGTDAMRRANELVGGWMREAGLSVREDAVGNLIGRRGDGPVADARLAPGHRARRRPLRRPARGARGDRRRRARPTCRSRSSGFADEEGLRFGTAYLGSAPWPGGFDPAWLGAARRGRRRARRPAARRPRDAPRAATCAATPRSTSSRARCSSGSASRSAWSPRSTARATPTCVFVGEAGHAGTVPHGRPARRACRGRRVGAGRRGHRHGRPARRSSPAARNVIPGARDVMTLDVRDPDDARAPRRGGTAARAGRARSRRAAACSSSGPTAATYPAVAMDERLTAAVGRRRRACPAAPATTPR